jgi:hypothetical protein
MREIHVSSVVDAVKKLCVEANYDLEPDMLRAFDRALSTERSAAGRQVLVTATGKRGGRGARGLRQEARDRGLRGPRH